MATRRKLTTIFCADVEGYGKNMARNEEATLANLDKCRTAMRELFTLHNGREINTWGDAVIAEFDSVVEAVRCAVGVQDAVECVDSEGTPLRFRIGINLGDVIDDGHSVYGDGVNQAARLEAACEPGQVLVSDTVYSLVNRQLALRFEPRSEIETKEGEDTLSGYTVRRDRTNKPPEEEPDLDQARKSQLAYTARKFAQIDRWIAKQSRTVQIAAGVIASLFLINLFFGGLANPWFIFPSIPFALFILWERRKGRR